MRRPRPRYGCDPVRAVVVYWLLFRVVPFLGVVALSAFILFTSPGRQP